MSSLGPSQTFLPQNHTSICTIHTSTNPYSPQVPQQVHCLGKSVCHFIYLILFWFLFWRLPIYSILQKKKNDFDTNSLTEKI